MTEVSARDEASVRIHCELRAPCVSAHVTGVFRFCDFEKQKRVFTGVPLLCDLAAMRGAASALGCDPSIIEPLVPVDLVVDHSVQVDSYGEADSINKNMKMEFGRNKERYQFLKWGMNAFKTFKVIPPGIGIVHQVNLEYLARGVHESDDVYYPDTLVGTDSHTT